jgi:regulator of replication initiation timing
MKVSIMSDTNNTQSRIPQRFALYKGAPSFDRLTKDYSTDMVRFEKNVESLKEENKELKEENKELKQENKELKEDLWAQVTQLKKYVEEANTTPRSLAACRWNDVVCISCRDCCEDFHMTWADHLGENKEKKAYGCPRCSEPICCKRRNSD